MALSIGLGCGDDPVSSPDAAPPPPAAEVPPPPRAPAPQGAFELPGLSAMRPWPRLSWPVSSVHVTSSFGWRVDPVSGRGTRLHRGMDFRGAIGDLVLSIGDGRVAQVGHDPFLGTMVVIDHGDGLRSWYGHLSDVLVISGVRVQRGAAIGLVGNTGRSAAPHLHLTVKLDGEAIDPLEVLGEPPHRPGGLLGPEPVVAPPAEPALDPEGALEPGTDTGTPADLGP
ncbi:MAG: M23 family metallopeptidase [Nannocystaceae bacterium]